MAAGKISYLDRSGHTEVAWDTEAPNTVIAARQEFDRLLRGGYIAYAMDKDSPTGRFTGTVIRSFDPLLEDIVMVPQLQGGAA